MKLPAQNKTALVLNHLLKYGTITSWEAIQKYRATRLSSIIYNLRKEHEIMSVTNEGENFCTYKYVCSNEHKDLLTKVGELYE